MRDGGRVGGVGHRAVKGGQHQQHRHGGRLEEEQRKARRSGGESGYNKFRYAAPATYQPAPAVETEPDVVPNENLLSGRNPIREALKSGRDIEKLLVARGELSGSAREIVQMAKERHIPVQEVDRARLDAITRPAGRAYPEREAFLYTYPAL